MSRARDRMVCGFVALLEAAWLSFLGWLAAAGG